MEQFIKVLKSYKRMTPGLEGCLLRNVHSMVLRRQDVINTACYPGNQLYFIEKGLFRNYLYNSREERVTCSFRKENDFILTLPVTMYGPYESYRGYEALEDSLVWVFTIDLVKHLMDNYTCFMEQYSAIMGKGMIQLDDSFRFDHMDPRERYRHLRQQSPDLLERVPIDIMASYIGVSAKMFGHLQRSRIQLYLSVDRRRRNRRDP